MFLRGGRKLEIAHVSMDSVGNVVSSLYDHAAGLYHALRLHGWNRYIAILARAGDDGNGLEHGDVPDVPQHRRHGHLSRTPPSDSQDEWTPPYILGGIALLGLFVYAFKFGMDAVIAGMLSGLLGVLVGRSTKGRGE